MQTNACRRSYDAETEMSRVSRSTDQDVRDETEKFKNVSRPWLIGGYWLEIILYKQWLTLS